MRKQLLRMAILVIMPLTVFAQSQELCEGDAVTTNDHYNAVVKQVFPDGLVKVVIDGGTYNYNINNLSKPISCLSDICAGSNVTTNDHYNAVVKQVFPDGFVKVVIDGGSYNYNISNLSLYKKCSQSGGTNCRQ